MLNYTHSMKGCPSAQKSRSLGCPPPGPPTPAVTLAFTPRLIRRSPHPRTIPCTSVAPWPAHAEVLELSVASNMLGYRDLRLAFLVVTQKFSGLVPEPAVSVGTPSTARPSGPARHIAGTLGKLQRRCRRLVCSQQGGPAGIHRCWAVDGVAAGVAAPKVTSNRFFSAAARASSAAES